MIDNQIKSLLLALSNSKKISAIDLIQGAWGGYGQLLRISVIGGNINSLIIKQIDTPQPDQHPKGWNTNRSHQRKLTSYQVESHWYQHYGQFHQQKSCYIPRHLFSDKKKDQQLLVLEDLREQGFPIVKAHCSLAEAKTCITWLAQFHLLHMHRAPLGLWETGSYWHLATRPDELENLQDSPLKAAANHIDQILSACPYQTLIHGDAKLANFCFSEDGKQVAAVDFQYVGQGCGMKDLILFISSAVKPEHCKQQAPLLVDHYFKALKQAAENSAVDAEQLENAWRPLYAIAWADFQRFVKGWSPDHWKINDYTESLTQQALGEIDALLNNAT
ncbi:phosphotransferase [Psychromonas marina]|uniref:Phosphotransferase n=1 Tax=Psychromonas marina TaxID=88364 RepID=A0ABQ6E2U2_9GAMM|nr:phosphotransferase [Psychromonas marina]GLS91697.1 phosphotransferase [Psychromonas marina]